jgi:hypothetical protein
MNNKNFQIHTLTWIFLLVLFTVGNAGRLIAQTEADEEKQKARISLDFFNINNEGQKLTATVKTKVEGFYQNVSGVEIQFFKMETSPENFLGKLKTDEHGSATISFSQSTDSTLWFTYIAVLENDPNFKDAEKEAEVKKGYMQMELEEIDSVKTIKIFVGAPDSVGNVNPVEEVNVRAYVKRLFGLLPISDELESTDEEGLLTIVFPSDIAGDENGNITIVTQVSDHDEFGNLEFRKNASWGVPFKLDKSKQDEELWLSSSNTPKVFVWMVNLMLLGVLGVIFYIFFQLFQIRKIGLKGSSKNTDE